MFMTNTWVIFAVYKTYSWALNMELFVDVSYGTGLHNCILIGCGTL